MTIFPWLRHKQWQGLISTLSAIEAERPEAEDYRPEDFSAEILTPKGGFFIPAIVAGQTEDENGNLTSRLHDNSVKEARIYNVHMQQMPLQKRILTIG